MGVRGRLGGEGMSGFVGAGLDDDTIMGDILTSEGDRGWVEEEEGWARVMRGVR